MQTVRNQMETESAGTIEIIDYAPRYKADFKRLNLEWIEAYFGVESIDETQLSHPESYFLQPGGYIYFAKYCGQIVGTCALLKHQDRGFELSKMGVTKFYRGMGIGRKLAETAIEKVRSLNENQLFLETNHMLIPAVNLYKHLGFQKRAFPDGHSARYQRANLYMILVL